MAIKRKGLERIQPMLETFINKLKPIYGEALKRVILFGSYARGEEHEESDVDIFLLLDMTEDEIGSKDHELSRAQFEMNCIDPTLDLQPVTVPLARFCKWKSVHPFYINVMEEGVPLYEAA